MNRSPRVLYVVGRARSGTTLLGDLLGQIEGFFHTGELYRLWRHFAEPSGALIRCSCGAAVQQCPLWKDVARRMLEAPDSPGPPSAVLGWQDEIARPRRVWKLAGERLLLNSKAARGLADALRCAYRAIADVTGARVVVDTSKGPLNALLLSELVDVPSVLVHLVRDPRAVIYSWTRSVPWPDGDLPPMRRYAPWGSALRWDIHNLLAGRVRARCGPERSALIRYEDLTATPRPVLEYLLDLTGESRATLPLNNGIVKMERGHVLGGNPSKFRTGEIEIREDSEWRRSLARRHKVVGTALTLPLLRRYGYPLRTS